MKRMDNLRIIRIDDLQQLAEGFDCGLVKLYQDVFSEPPYNEHFSEDEIKETFTAYVKEGILFLSYCNHKAVGFGAAMPFLKSAIAELGEQFEFNLKRAWYMADLGVKKDVRRCGLARQLVQARLNAFEPGTIAIMRTSQDNTASQSLYKSLGFQLVPIKQDVIQKRQNGTERADTRIFMAKKVDTTPQNKTFSNEAENKLVRVRLWTHRDGSADIVYFEVPARTVEQLAEFVEKGKVPSEIRSELQAILQDFPLWSHLSIDDHLHREQRSSVAGNYVVANGRKLELKNTLSLDVTLY